MNPLEQAIDLYEHMKGEPVVNVREQLGDVPVLTPQEIALSMLPLFHKVKLQNPIM